jgi:hypothetical protein
MTEHARSKAGDVTGHLTEGTATFGRLFVDLLGEQVRHSLEVATAIGRSVAWGEIIRVQGEFVHASLERWGRLNGGYLEIVRSAAPTAEDQSRKAA